MALVKALTDKMELYTMDEIHQKSLILNLNASGASYKCIHAFINALGVK